MYLNTYISIEIFIELFYNISSQVTCIPHAYNPHRALFVPWHYVMEHWHMLCVACAGCYRDWVNFILGKLSPKVTLMLPDILLSMCVK
jgi:hypothetical protein